MGTNIKMYESHRFFRAKSLETGEWLYGDLLDSGDCATINKPDDIDTWAGRYVKRNTICQSTGLSSKDNSTFIFEGDIISLKYEIRLAHSVCGYGSLDGKKKEEAYKILEETFAQKKIKYAYNKEILDDAYGLFGCRYFYYRNCFVEFDPQTGGWRLRNKDVTHRMDRDYLFNHDACIIGNIYDNPELLDVVDNETVTRIPKENF